MFKFATATSAAALLLALMPSAAQAESIKDLISDSQLAEYCTQAGVDTETSASLTLPDGTIAVGTIHCEAEDLIVGDDDLEDDGLDDEDEDEDEVEDEDEAEDDDDSSDDDDESDDDESDDDESDDDESDDDE